MVRKSLPKVYEPPTATRVGHFTTDTLGRWSRGRKDGQHHGYRRWH